MAISVGDQNRAIEVEEHAHLLEFCLLNHIWSRPYPTGAEDLNLIKAGILIRSAAISRRMSMTNFSDVMANLADIWEEEGDGSVLHDHCAHLQNEVQTEKIDKEGILKGDTNLDLEQDLDSKTGGVPQDRDFSYEEFKPFGSPSEKKYSSTDSIFNMPPEVSEKPEDENANILLLLTDSSSFYEKLTQQYRNYLNIRNNLIYLDTPEKPGEENSSNLTLQELNTAVEELMHDVQVAEGVTTDIDKEGLSNKLSEQLKIVNDIIKLRIPVLNGHEAADSVKDINDRLEDCKGPNILLDFVEFFTGIMPVWSIPDEKIEEFLPPGVEEEGCFPCEDSSSLSLSFTSSDLYPNINPDLSTDLRLVPMDLSTGWSDPGCESLDILELLPGPCVEASQGEDLNADLIRTSTPAEEQPTFSHQQILTEPLRFDPTTDSSIYPKITENDCCHSRRRLWDDTYITAPGQECEGVDGVMPLNTTSSRSEALLQHSQRQIDLKVQTEVNSTDCSSLPPSSFTLFPNMQFSQASETTSTQPGINSQPVSKYAVARPNQGNQFRSTQPLGPQPNHHLPHQTGLLNVGQPIGHDIQHRPVENLQYSGLSTTKDTQPPGPISGVGGSTLGPVPLEPHHKLVPHPEPFFRPDIQVLSGLHYILHNKQQSKVKSSNIRAEARPFIPASHQLGRAAHLGVYPSVLSQLSSHQHSHIPLQSVPFQQNAYNQMVSAARLSNSQQHVHHPFILPYSQMDNGVTGNPHQVGVGIQKQPGWPCLPLVRQQGGFPEIGLLPTQILHGSKLHQGQTQQAVTSQQNYFRPLCEDVPPWRKRRHHENAYAVKDTMLQNNYYPRIKMQSSLQNHTEPLQTHQPNVNFQQSVATGPSTQNFQLASQEVWSNGIENERLKLHSLQSKSYDAQLQNQQLNDFKQIFNEHQQQQLRQLARNFPDVSDVKIAKDFQAMLQALNTQ